MSEKEQATQSLSPEERQVIRNIALAMAVVIKNERGKFWLSERDRAHALDDTHEYLRTGLNIWKSVLFKLEEDQLDVSGLTFAPDDEGVLALRNAMVAAEAVRFCIDEKVTTAELDLALKTLCLTPMEIEQKGGFAAALAEQEIKNIRVSRSVYRKISEDEVVVRKASVVGDISEGGQVVSSGLLAFLAGPDILPSEAVEKQAKAAVLDPQHLAQILARAASQSMPQHEGAAAAPEQEQSGEQVANGIRQAVGNLSKTSVAGTRKGRHQLEKSLRSLEKRVDDILKHLPVPNDDDKQKITTAIQEAREDLRAEDIGTDLVKKEQARQKSEKEMQVFLKQQAEDPERARRFLEGLRKKGLDAASLERIVSGSGVDIAPAFVTDVAPETTDRLARLLSHMQQIVSATEKKISSEATTDLAITTAGVRNAVTQSVEAAEAKVRKFARDTRKSSPGKPGGMSRKKMLETLAEIVQELCQPLSVIGCCLDMVTNEKLGPIEDSQRSMLQLASDSSDRIGKLTDALRKIAGEPDSLEPDLKMTSSFYE